MIQKILLILGLLVQPVSSYYPIPTYYESPVVIEWDHWGDSYEYIFEYATDEHFYDIQGTVGWTEEYSYSLNVWYPGTYYWRVRARLKNTTEEVLVQTGFFYFQTDIPEIEEPRVEIPTKEEEEILVKEEPVVEEEEIPLHRAGKTIVDIKKKETVLGAEDIQKEDAVCRYKYFIRKKKYQLVECNIPKPEISSTSYYNFKEMKVVEAKGTYTHELTVEIENIECKGIFKCKENHISTHYYKTPIYYYVYFLNDEILPPKNFIFNKEDFEISGIYDSVPLGLHFKGMFSVNHMSKWLDQRMHLDLESNFKEVVSKNNGIYSFPFSRLIGVTQWYGCTVYQCPHMGIDFGSGKENIYAISDAYVVDTGWDNSGGECKSGGNYVVLKHSNGQHSVYFHLSKISVKKNTNIKKGEVIGISGNTGKHNCQDLGYHLHFELRNQRARSTHTNPVPYIDVDWNLIPTLGYKQYPGRLGGENPHPNF